MSQVPKLLEDRPASVTVWRWMTKGCRGIKLESLIVNGSRRTTKQALHQFFAAITAQANGEREQARTPKQRERDIDRARARAERSLSQETTQAALVGGLRECCPVHVTWRYLHYV